MSTEALIVTDMVKGFCEEGHNLYFPESRQIIGEVRDWVIHFLTTGKKVVCLADTHVENDLEFKMFPRHCVEGTEEPEIIPELRLPGTIVIPKRRYSGFFDTKLDEWLGRPKNLMIVGVCTNSCVQYTAADARNRDYLVKVPPRAVATFDWKDHEQALHHMEKILGVEVSNDR